MSKSLKIGLEMVAVVLVALVIIFLVVFELPEIQVFEDWSMIIKIGVRLW